MTKKADVKISLHFIIGLMFSVVLILVVWGAIGRLSEIIDPHYERDLVDQWIEDIDLLNQDDSSYATELLSLDSVKTEVYFIAVFQQGTKSMNFDLNKVNTNFTKPKSCRGDSCICTYNIEKSEFEYCKRLGADRITALTKESNGDPITTNGIAIFSDNTFGLFGLSKWSRDGKLYSDTLVAASKVYAERRSSWIYICFNVKDNECTV